MSSISSPSAPSVGPDVLTTEQLVSEFVRLNKEVRSLCGNSSPLVTSALRKCAREYSIIDRTHHQCPSLAQFVVDNVPRERVMEMLSSLAETVNDLYNDSDSESFSDAMEQFPDLDSSESAIRSGTLQDRPRPVDPAPRQVGSPLSDEVGHQSTGDPASAVSTTTPNVHHARDVVDDIARAFPSDVILVNDLLAHAVAVVDAPVVIPTKPIFSLPVFLQSTVHAALASTGQPFLTKEQVEALEKRIRLYDGLPGAPPDVALGHSFTSSASRDAALQAEQFKHVLGMRGVAQLHSHILSIPTALTSGLQTSVEEVFGAIRDDVGMVFALFLDLYIRSNEGRRVVVNTEKSVLVPNIPHPERESWWQDPAATEFPLHGFLFGQPGDDSKGRAYLDPNKRDPIVPVVAPPAKSVQGPTAQRHSPSPRRSKTPSRGRSASSDDNWRSHPHNQPAAPRAPSTPRDDDDSYDSRSRSPSPPKGGRGPAQEKKKGNSPQQKKSDGNSFRGPKSGGRRT